MPYCSKCGSPVGISDTFCTKCGTYLNTQPSFQLHTYVNFPSKPSTNLAYGLTIGGGLALLLVGLLMALALNGIYAQQTNYLAAEGLQVNTYGFGLNSLVHLISLGIYIAFLGAYLLILGSLNQFSLKVRTAMLRKDDRTRLGITSISGGFIFAALFSQTLIEQLYQPYHSDWFGPVTALFVVGGLASIFIGALLIRSSYLRSLSPTKFKEQNHSPTITK
jgi:hypothetical protein